MPVDKKQHQNSKPVNLTLRDIYLDLPKNISKILVEAGITSLLNCIETQKRMVLSAHYITSRLSSTILSNPNANNAANKLEFDLLVGQLCDIFTNSYLKNEILHSEENLKLYTQVTDCLDNFEPKENEFEKKLKEITKFMKKGSQLGTSMNCSSKNITDALTPSQDMDCFKEYYRLGDADIIDEAEDIATHLMNEIADNKSKGIFQDICYDDSRRFMGFYKNGKRNGDGCLQFTNGDIYEGEWFNNKIQGRGIYRFSSGATYKGEFFNNLRNGEGEYTFKDQKKYIGKWRNGKRNGTGKLIWPNGDKYIGYFVNGKRDGTGIFESHTGASYEGAWKNGRKEGEGILTLKNGDVYYGKFKEDNIEGYGTMHYKDGRVYEGEWSDGKRNGEGVLTLKTGDKFMGSFQEGFLTGYSECFFSDGSVYKGMMEKSKKEGKGVYSWKSGDCYKGEFKNCMRHGNGVYTYDNGNEYSGEWAFDLEEGEGILSINGKILKGIWEAGVLVEILEGMDEELKDILGRCMEKIPSFSIPSEDGVILE